MEFVEFIFLGSKYRTNADLSVIERQHSMNKRWAVTYSMAVHMAAKEALAAKARSAPIL